MSQLTGIFFQTKNRYVGYCLEIPSANGQGRTLKECEKSLSAAVRLLIEDYFMDLLNHSPGPMEIRSLQVDEKKAIAELTRKKRVQTKKGRTHSLHLDQSGNGSRRNSSPAPGNRRTAGKKNSKIA